MRKIHLTTGLLIILAAIPLTILLLFKVAYIRGKAAEPVYVLATIKLTNDEIRQKDPDVFGDLIAWQNYATRNGDIAGVRVDTNTLIPQPMIIPNTEEVEANPRVGSDGIVWWGTRMVVEYDQKGNPHGKLDEGEVFFWPRGQPDVVNLTDHSLQQWDPDIWENTVVWEDWRNGNPDIYSFDLSREEIATISAQPFYQERPSVWNNIVVWHHYPEDAIYYYNLVTKEQGFLDFQSYEDSQNHQDISDDIVVWQDKRNGNWDIYGYNLASHQPVEIYAGPGNQTDPSVSGNYVVWEDDSRGNKDIRGINLLTQEVFDIAATDKDEVTPAISGQLVVWEEDPSGVSDIVLAKLRPLRSAPPSPFLQSLESQFAESSVLLRWLVNQPPAQNMASLRLSLTTVEGEVAEVVSLPTNASTHTFSNLQNGQRYISTLEALGSTGIVLQSLSVAEIPRCRLEDLNGNGRVDIFDIVLVARSFESREGEGRYDALVDLIKDGEINIFDLVKVARAWGQGC